MKDFPSVVLGGLRVNAKGILQHRLIPRSFLLFLFSSYSRAFLLLLSTLPAFAEPFQIVYSGKDRDYTAHVFNRRTFYHTL